jgi:16S rRNA (guanine1516-N2)-methyltransferase
MTDKRVSVHADPVTDEQLVCRAKVLAQRLSLSYSTPSLMMLTLTADHLELRLRGDKGKPVFCDLLKLDTQSPAGRSLKQPLVKALGIKKRSDSPLRVLDATAGWGEDTWLMHAQGCQVHALERNPVVAALLEDALIRAMGDETFPSDSLCVKQGCALDWLAHWFERNPAGTTWSEIDVVYLDPMFPPGRKTAQRKPMLVLHDLVGQDEDAQALVPLALEVARKRVVVKRPPKAPALLPEPVVSHGGKGVRYDVYIPGITKIR